MDGLSQNFKATVYSPGQTSPPLQLTNLPGLVSSWVTKGYNLRPRDWRKFASLRWLLVVSLSPQCG